MLISTLQQSPMPNCCCWPGILWPGQGYLFPSKSVDMSMECIEVVSCSTLLQPTQAVINNHPFVLVARRQAQEKVDGSSKMRRGSCFRFGRCLKSFQCKLISHIAQEDNSNFFLFHNQVFLATQNRGKVRVIN